MSFKLQLKKKKIKLIRNNKVVCFKFRNVENYKIKALRPENAKKSWRAFLAGINKKPKKQGIWGVGCKKILQPVSGP